MARRTPSLASKFVFVSAALALAASLSGCTEDEDTGVTPATDTGVAADTGPMTDSGDTGSDTGTVTDSASATETGSDAGSAPSCETYCNAVTTNCVGARNAQYIDKARCVAMCAKLTVGTLADKDGDTLGCRLFHANAAKDSPDVSCPKAGATGGGACGTTRCDSFCKLAMAQCPTGAPFTTEADCKTKCPEGTFDTSAAEIDMTSKTLNCMQYHLQAAYQSSSAAGVHCPHLTVTSGPCGP